MGLICWLPGPQGEIALWSFLDTHSLYSVIRMPDQYKNWKSDRFRAAAGEICYRVNFPLSGEGLGTEKFPSFLLMAWSQLIFPSVSFSESPIVGNFWYNSQEVWSTFPSQGHSPSIPALVPHPPTPTFPHPFFHFPLPAPGLTCFWDKGSWIRKLFSILQTVTMRGPPLGMSHLWHLGI